MKILLIFLLFCTSAFATEPHFDLCKKDATEQCAEVERVVKECGESMITDGKYLTHIPTWLIKKHKKLIDNSKIAIKVEDCYVKEVKLKY